MEINELLAIIMFGSFIALLISGFPIGWVLGGVALIFALLAMAMDAWFGSWIGIDWPYLSITIPRIWSLMNSWVLVALPMFIYMGLMLDRAGIAEELMLSLEKLFAQVRGGLAVAVAFVGLLLAATTGIIGASVVLLALLGLPLMLRQGYSPALACGTVCSAGTLGILIPPSIMLVMMGDRLGLAVGDLFLGALLPGLMLAGLYVAYILGLGLLRPEHTPTVEGQAPLSVALIGQVLLAVLPAGVLMLVVLGSIFTGLATPTEASGIGALGATLLAGYKGRLSRQVVHEVCLETTRTTGFIFALLVGAMVFSLVLRGLGGDELIERGLTGLPFGPTGIVLVILLATFVLGFFLDWIELTLIVLPLVAPVISGLGFDLVWFTVLFAVCLQTSFLTPPVGFALFYLKGVAPHGIGLPDIYRGVLPFIVIQLIGLSLVFYWEGLATWLPGIAY